MAPDTGLQPFVNASASSMALGAIPTSPRITRDMALEEQDVDPDAKLILSDFTQITEYFPMDLYRSMFFIHTLDHEYNRALDSFDNLARKLYDRSLSEEQVARIKGEMSRNLNLMMANRNETLAEATRLYETTDQAFNALDASITVAEENLNNPPSSTYFLPTPPLEDDVEDEEDLSEESEIDDDQADVASIKTDDLTTAHLEESELKALRRRMKKSFQWQPTTSCIKKELQMVGRWPPVRPIDKSVRHRKKLASIKRKRQRQILKSNRNRALAGRRAAQARSDQKATQRQKKQEAKVQYAMPVAADEPTYCYCGDVSYGEMIACENESCSREWFHLECVGLDAAPRGKWYCRDCKPGGDSAGTSRKRKRA